MSINNLNNNELENIIILFTEYEKQKDEGILYQKGNLDIPKKLIHCYYSLDEQDRNLDDLTDNFVNHYIECEAILEDSHSHQEKEGMAVMYEYIHSSEINNNFDIYTLLDLHQKLYSVIDANNNHNYDNNYTFGGHTRNADCHINGSRVNFLDYLNIWSALKTANYDLENIMSLANQISEKKEKLFEYIDACIRLKCKLIKIHPFVDGNGRSIRGFINKLFLNVGIPSVYISANEDKVYRRAMNKAIVDDSDNCEAIIQFYYYKICDSIFELGIKPKLYGYMSIPEQILKQTKKWKTEIEKTHISHDLWNDDISLYIVSYFINESIGCTLHSTNENKPEYLKHNYITVCYHDKKGEKNFIIDPMFNSLINNVININKNDAFIDSLAKYGITSFNEENKENYEKLFENTMNLEKPFSKIKKKQLPIP